VTPALIKRWYGYIKFQNCFSCGARGDGGNPIEAAHFRLVISGKTGDLLPRSHKTEAAWGAVPLCRACHLRQHTMSETVFREEISNFAEKWGTLLLRFFTEERSPF